MLYYFSTVHRRSIFCLIVDSLQLDLDLLNFLPLDSIHSNGIEGDKFHQVTRRFLVWLMSVGWISAKNTDTSP